MTKAADLLPVFFDEYAERDPKRNPRRVSGLFYSWAAVSREQRIAAASDHARIAELERGIVLIEADHPGWIQILQTKEQGILESFRHRFPELDITGVSFRLSRGKIKAWGEFSDVRGGEDAENTALRTENGDAASGGVDSAALLTPFVGNTAFQKLLSLYNLKERGHPQK